mmetsp:Transcript_74879/g.178754  ORF Transcript_74879/g.178754 Transcript_74879/m.178754 type:complete len:761 (+) Transcript_74879:59-2341(+)
MALCTTCKAQDFCIRGIRAMMISIGMMTGAIYLHMWSFSASISETLWPQNTSDLEFSTRQVSRVQFQYQLCHGLTNQRLQLIDGILVALFLGAQVVLPEKMQWNGAQFMDVSDVNMQPLSRIWNMPRLKRQVQDLYTEFWCRRKELASNVWCATLPAAAIVFDPNQSASFEAVRMHLDQWTPERLLKKGQELWRNSTDRSWSELAPSQVLRIVEPCEFWFKTKVTEDSEMWHWFWAISNALDFSGEVVSTSEQLKRLMYGGFGHAAFQKAKSLGYSNLRNGSYHVVHLRAEEDWKRHCALWTSWAGKRDNCMNNTFEIGNVLLSEGITPSVPIYLATGLSTTELQHLRESGSLPNLFDIYTVVTKDMLNISQAPLVDDRHREYWAAVDFVISQDAETFIGNSVSTFSAFLLEMRRIRNQSSLHYNGGKVPLEEINLLRPKKLTLVSPIRPAIKWVFTLGDVKPFDSVYNATMVSVQSAQAKTALVPICVTAANPYSDLVVLLVSMGVRVIYHKPAWRATVDSVVGAWNADVEKLERLHKWPADPKKVADRVLRIDIPLLGILDQFVLYTDTDVIFTGPVTWQDLIGEKADSLIATLERKMLGRGLFKQYAKPGHFGVPQFYAVSGEKNQNSAKDADTGVMLMNLPALRNTYKAFENFLFSDDHLLRGQADPAGYLKFYVDSNGQSMSAILPFNLNWKPFWKPNRNAQIVQFYGPKCDTDILPFLQDGTVHFEPYRKMLTRCAEGNCEQLCREYHAVLAPG